MNPKKEPLAGKTSGKSETSATASISEGSIPPPADNLSPGDVTEISFMRELIPLLTDRLLAAWALKLRGATPTSSMRGYIFCQLVRVELRRRRRNGGAL